MSIWTWIPELERRTEGLESPNMWKVGHPGYFQRLEPGEDINNYIEPKPNPEAGKCCPDCGSIPGKANR